MGRLIESHVMTVAAEVVALSYLGLRVREATVAYLDDECGVVWGMPSGSPAMVDDPFVCVRLRLDEWKAGRFVDASGIRKDLAAFASRFAELVNAVAGALQTRGELDRNAIHEIFRTHRPK